MYWPNTNDDVRKILAAAAHSSFHVDSQHGQQQQTHGIGIQT